MSHVTNVKTAFKNPEVLKKAADKLGIKVEIAEKGKTLSRKLYQGAPIEGVAAFQLPGWRYEAVVQEDGSCKADNYGGSWGNQSEMDKLSQEYGVQLASSILRKQGHRILSDQVDTEGTREIVFVS